MLARKIKRFHPAARFDSCITVGREQIPKQLHVEFVIFDDQHQRCLGSGRGIARLRPTSLRPGLDRGGFFLVGHLGTHTGCAQRIASVELCLIVSQQCAGTGKKCLKFGFGFGYERTINLARE
jgi:hypothetical protein